MCFRLSKNSKVERILLVSLSNIGDVALTFPALDVLRETFSEAALHVIVGPNASTFFVGNPYVQRVIVYDKKMSWKEKWIWLQDLRRDSFDLVVDLRNSMLPFLLRARCVTLPAVSLSLVHMKDKHLKRLDSVLFDSFEPRNRYSVFLSLPERQRIEGLVHGLKDYVVVAPGAADNRKRWLEAGFTRVIEHVMSRYGKKIVVVGGQNDRPVVDRILKDIPDGVVNLCGFTTLVELAGIVEQASLAVTNDSGIMHLASYCDIPTIALFGPTDPSLYGPWSSERWVVRKGDDMGAIAPRDVLAAIDTWVLRHERV